MEQHNSVCKICQKQIIFDSSQHESRNLALASELRWALCCGENGEVQRSISAGPTVRKCNLLWLTIGKYGVLGPMFLCKVVFCQ
jgi:hypothetical protein